jgi:hypothetical protein
VPLAPPPIDTRSYRQLVDETLARVPVHTPEWTNFTSADPGVTLVQLFAFLTESLLYRANQVPDRNRAKFLQLLGVPLRTATESRGLVTFANERGALEARTLPGDVELVAGEMPFRTTAALDVLPVEARLFTKRAADPAGAVKDYYSLLYASYDRDLADGLSFYETVAFDPAQGPVDLADTVDRSLWIALLGRPADALTGAPDPWARVREALGGRTLSLGLAPTTEVELVVAQPGQPVVTADLLAFEMPQPAADGSLLFDAEGRPEPGYRRLAARAAFDPLTAPGIVQLTLPPADGLTRWRTLDPLESGVGDLPPTLDDTALDARLVTWLRVRATGAAKVRLRWAGINAAFAHQRTRVRAERLADGDGTPDQVRRLSRAPVLAQGVEITVAGTDEDTLWTPIDDLLAAAPEVPVPGVEAHPASANVFLLDAEAGAITFGDGLAGRRPPPGARLYARYDYSQGVEGNVGAGAIKAGPLVPAGYTATNPLPTWGGSDAESVADGEKQVRRMLQHRDRLVTADDFRVIARRTPGVEIGRIEVLPAWHPALAPAATGAAPGVVTLLAIPAHDPTYPDAPRADRRFLDAICRYCDPRRLVTTELVLTGAVYKPVWVSVGIEVAGGLSIADVTDAVASRIRAALSPLPPAGTALADQEAALYAPEGDPALRGWPLNRDVHQGALLAEVARVAGVVQVTGVQIALGNGGAVTSVPIDGVELPELAGLSVVAGDPIDLQVLRGDAGTATPGDAPPRLPVPVVAETC